LRRPSVSSPPARPGRTQSSTASICRRSRTTWAWGVRRGRWRCAGCGLSHLLVTLEPGGGWCPAVEMHAVIHVVVHRVVDEPVGVHAAVADVHRPGFVEPAWVAGAAGETEVPRYRPTCRGPRVNRRAGYRPVRDRLVIAERGDSDLHDAGRYRPGAARRSALAQRRTHGRARPGPARLPRH
jgi:hypothetical protein